jgi:hypothetical protein
LNKGGFTGFYSPGGIILSFYTGTLNRYAMENERKYKLSIGRQSMSYGIIAGICYILFFLLMRAVGLMAHFELRHVNLLIMTGFTIAALAKVNGKTRNKLEFLTGLGIAMLVAGVSFAIFGAFMFFYLKYLDPAFMQHLIQTAPFGEYLTPANTAGWVIHEGFGSQVIIGLIVVETFKLIQMSTNSNKPQYK